MNKPLLVRQSRVTGIFFGLLLLAGCATLSPSKVVDNSYIADGPYEEVATVNFIRDDGFWGKGVAVPVYLNSELAMKLRVETFTTLTLKPGRYDIATGKDPVQLPGTDPAKKYHGALIFLPGKTYSVILYPEQYGVRTDQYGIEWPEEWIKFESIDIDEATIRMSSYEFIPLNMD